MNVCGLSVPLCRFIMQMFMLILEDMTETNTKTCKTTEDDKK